jgi:hypothetical protein
MTPWTEQAYQFRGTALTLLRQFEEEVRIDTDAEKKTLRWGCSAGIAFLLFIASIPLTINLSEKELSLFWLLPILVAAAVVVCIVRAVRASRYNLDNRKLETVRRFLQIVRVDTPKEAPLAIDVDFRGYQKGGTLRSEPPKKLFNSKPREYDYSHPWLKIEGALADGTAYSFAVVDRVKRREKPKRKYTKVREAIRSRVVFLLWPKGSRHPAAATMLVPALEEIPLPAPLIRKRLAFRAGRLQAVLELPQAIRVNARRSGVEPDPSLLLGGDTLLGILMWGYAGLGRANRTNAA